MRVLLLFLTLSLSLPSVVNSQELDLKLEQLRELSDSLETTIKKYNKFGHRKEGFKKVSQLDKQLADLLPKLEELAFEMKVENKKLKVEVASQAAEIRRLRRTCSKELVCELKVFGRSFIGVSTNERAARLKAKDKCLNSFHEVQCNGQAQCE